MTQQQKQREQTLELTNDLKEKIKHTCRLVSKTKKRCILCSDSFLEANISASLTEETLTNLSALISTPKQAYQISLDSTSAYISPVSN